MKLIPLSGNRFSAVDDKDFVRASEFRWSASKGGKTYYAVRTEKIDGKNVSISLHRFIMNAPPGKEVDHINGKGLDNRRANLRIVTHAENGANRPSLNRNNRSGIAGVSLCKRTGKWQALIMRAGKMFHLGRFIRKEDAASAREDARKKFDA